MVCESLTNKHFPLAVFLKGKKNLYRFIISEVTKNENSEALFYKTLKIPYNHNLYTDKKLYICNVL